jgi:hypothetical protein
MSYSNGPKMITNGLVLYLDAANPRSYTSGSSVWNDLSNNGNNGTLTNGPTYNTGSKGSIVFDGTNDYVELASRNTNLEFQPTQAYSVFGWFFNISSGGGGTLISNMVGNSPYPGWDLWRNDSSTIAMHLISTWSSNAIKIKINFNYSSYTNRWVYFGYTYDGTCPTNAPDSLSSVNFYENAVLNQDGKGILDTIGFTSSSATITYDSSQRLRIASRWASGAANYPISLTNSIVQIYNRALTPSEIKQNYNASKGRYIL